MRTTRRGFLGAAAVPQAEGLSHGAELDGFSIARRHRIVRGLPTPSFFEGMLLGNGDVGVCVTVRPDALGLHLGKEDSWDIRVSEDHYQHVLHFRELLKLWERASAEAKRQGQPEMLHLETSIDFFREYTGKVRSSYAKAWPRPWPCGVVWAHWDARMVRLVRQVLDPSNGVLRVTLEHDDLKGKRRQFTLECLVNQVTGHVVVASAGWAPVLSVAYYPNIDREAGLPAPELEAKDGEFSCYQHFPAVAPTAEQPNPPRTERDRNFALCGRLSGKWTAELSPVRVFFKSGGEQEFRLDVTLTTPRDARDNVRQARMEAAGLAAIPMKRLQAESELWWRGFWGKSEGRSRRLMRRKQSGLNWRVRRPVRSTAGATV